MNPIIQPGFVMGTFTHSDTPSSSIHRLIGLVVKEFASRALEPGFNSHFLRVELPRPVIPKTKKLALQWLTCQASGVIGSALGLIESVSVYLDNLFCYFYLSVAARKIVFADPSMRYTRILLGRKAINQRINIFFHSQVYVNASLMVRASYARRVIFGNWSAEVTCRVVSSLQRSCWTIQRGSSACTKSSSMLAAMSLRLLRYGCYVTYTQAESGLVHMLWRRYVFSCIL